MQDSEPTASFHLGSLLAEGYLAPRRSMARVLSLKLDEGERLLMVAIAIVVSCLGVALTAERTEEVGFIIVVFGYVLTIVGGLVQYRLLSWLVGIIARATGGTGEGNDNQTLVAWWMLVTAPLPIIMMVAMQNGESPVAVLILFGVAILTLVLLAAYITEVHRFRSTATVVGAMIALLMVFSFVFSAMMPVPG